MIRYSQPLSKVSSAVTDEEVHEDETDLKNKDEESSN